MRRTLLLLATLAACGGANPSSAAGAGDPDPAQAAAAPGGQDAAAIGYEVGQRAPAFTLTTLGGEQVVLAEALRAGPVALVFGSYT